MTWRDLLAERRVVAEATSRAEISDLRLVVKRSLADAQLKGLSSDGRFSLAYDAGRTLAVIIVRAEGYRVKIEGGGHYNTFLALKAAEPGFKTMSVYLDSCRKKRNDFLYEEANVVSDTEAENLLMKVTAFSLEVEAWLRKHHQNLL